MPALAAVMRCAALSAAQSRRQKASKQAKLLSTAEILELGDVCNYIIINADMVRSSGSISQAALHIVVRQSV